MKRTELTTRVRCSRLFGTSSLPCCTRTREVLLRFIPSFIYGSVMGADTFMSWGRLVRKILVAFGICFYAEFLPLWLFNNTTAIELVRAVTIGAATDPSAALSSHGSAIGRCHS